MFNFKRYDSVVLRNRLGCMMTNQCNTKNIYRYFTVKTSYQCYLIWYIDIIIK